MKKLDSRRVKVSDTSAPGLRKLIEVINRAITEGWHIEKLSIDDRAAGSVYIDVALEREIPAPKRKTKR